MSVQISESPVQKNYVACVFGVDHCLLTKMPYSSNVTYLNKYQKKYNSRFFLKNPIYAQVIIKYQKTLFKKIMFSAIGGI